MSLVKVVFNDKASVVAEVADTDDKKRVGLMWRKDLPDDRGMLFPYKEADTQSIWMKNTHIKLSVVFADSDGVIRKIADGQPHCLDPISCDNVKYVIEVKRGFCDKHDIKGGDTIELENIDMNRIKTWLTRIANDLEKNDYVSHASYIDGLVKVALGDDQYYYDYASQPPGNIQDVFVKGKMHSALIQSDKETRANQANDVRREIAQKLNQSFKHDLAQQFEAISYAGLLAARRGDVEETYGGFSQFLNAVKQDESGTDLLQSLRGLVFDLMAKMAFVLYATNVADEEDVEPQIMDVVNQLNEDSGGQLNELPGMVEQTINSYKRYLMDRSVSDKQEKREMVFKPRYVDEREKRFEKLLKDYKKLTGKKMDPESDKAIEMFRRYLLDVYPKEIIPLMKKTIENPYDDIPNDVKYKMSAWIKLDNNPFRYDIDEIEAAIDVFGDRISDQPLTKEEKRKIKKAKLVPILYT